MRVRYAFRWNWSCKGPATPLSERRARMADADGKEYTALVWEPAQDYPTVVNVVWETDSVVVGFPDEHGRAAVNYRFRRVDPETLFLQGVDCYCYPSDDPNLRLADSHRCESYTFEPGGLVTVQDSAASSESVTRRRDIDLTPNWEPVPCFGDWASITRFER